MQHDNASADAIGGPNEKVLGDEQHELAGTQPVKLLTEASMQDPDRAPVNTLASYARRTIAYAYRAETPSSGSYRDIGRRTVVDRSSLVCRDANRLAYML